MSGYLHHRMAIKSNSSRNLIEIEFADYFASIESNNLIYQEQDAFFCIYQSIFCGFRHTDGLPKLGEISSAILMGFGVKK